MWSSLLRGYLYWKVTDSLSHHRQFHKNWTSFKRSPVLKDHFFFIQRWHLNTGLTLYEYHTCQLTWFCRFICFTFNCIKRYVLSFLLEIFLCVQWTSFVILTNTFKVVNAKTKYLLPEDSETCLNQSIMAPTFVLN